MPGAFVAFRGTGDCEVFFEELDMESCGCVSRNRISNSIILKPGMWREFWEVELGVEGQGDLHLSLPVWRWQLRQQQDPRLVKFFRGDALHCTCLQRQWPLYVASGSMYLVRGAGSGRDMVVVSTWLLHIRTKERELSIVEKLMCI